MSRSRLCRFCKATGSGRTIRVTLSDARLEGWHLCWSCLNHLERGFRRTEPDGALEALLDGRGFCLTEPQLHGLMEAGLQAASEIPVTPGARPELERRRQVRGDLREIGFDLEDATAANARGDFAAALDAVRMIHGRAVVTRRALEGMLGAHPGAADLPPLVRAVQAVGRLISDREVDTLEPAELRARTHAVLQALDRELQAFLDPPEPTSAPDDRDPDALPGGLSAPERP